ncbi:uncharacterized protein LOC110463415 isoform X3 [Mizuhopecten yessoensis]|uniref:uncharacterized protein LOC110463415 isoform X3 n=1 Tax=Mizuhopecten yessoensis TaxID=6573 RepID=UPI000B45AEED|nr:uncharacterized protein LOC110463415 isoform X3 [Mizuhopecten yessoensis]
MESLKNVQKSETLTDFDPSKHGDLPAFEVLGNSVTKNFEMTDVSPFALIEPDDHLADQSEMCSGHLFESQEGNLDQSENVGESISPNQSEQFVNDRTDQNNQSEQFVNDTTDQNNQSEQFINDTTDQNNKSEQFVNDTTDQNNQSEQIINDTTDQNNQSEQFVNDTTDQNKGTFQDLNQTEDTNSGEKMSQSDLKVSLAVSDCSTKVESKGSSARSRSEVSDSKYVKKVDIVYPKDQLADRKDGQEAFNSNNPNEVEIKSLDGENSTQYINVNISSEQFTSDAIQIGSTLKKGAPDVKSQRKVIRSEVKISEVMTQQFDPSLYDREKLKVTGVPFKKEDNFSDPGFSVLTQSRSPLKVRESKIPHSELSPTRETVNVEPNRLKSVSFPLVMKKTDISFKMTGDTTNMESCKIQNIDQEARQENSVQKSNAVRVQNFRPVQRVRETIDEDRVLTFHTEIQGIMGDFVTPLETQTQIVPKSKTEDEIRATSALSRASLRKEYRNKLGEVRAAVEDRRTKSPAISIPSQRSLEDDQLIDEDDDDDIPYNDIEELKKEQTMEMGTSPPPGQKGQSSSRLSQISGDHPIVTEYLRLYEGVVEFRGILSKLMVDRDMLQPSEILEDIDMMKFNGTGKVEPQLEHMTHNVFHVFEEIITVLSSLLLADREPMVSSLTGGGMMMSRDTTQAMVGPKSAESGRGPTVTRASHHSQFSAKSDVSERIALRELQEQYDRLQHQLTGETRKHDEQLRHNTVVMMEMQDTINDLQRELSNLGRSSSRLRPQSDTTSPHGTTDSAVMFTRLDSERNCKIMKRAVNDQKMEADKYKDALVKMEDYVGLPAQRFAHLVRKYVHHSRMKEIEENVKKSKSLNENVFEILDKMEALQNERAKTWADKMDQMGSERLRLANLLMETLDSIEQESGIFLIKPMYSYRGRDIKDARYGGKLTRPMRSQRNLSPHRENLSSFAPAPTPASNMRLIRGQPVPTTQSMTHEIMPKHEAPRPLEGDEGGITGASLNWVGTSQKQTWSMNSSVVRGDPENFLSSQNPNAMNTPRILELDINRMLIGQNTISSKITQPGLTEDRLVNASQNNLRSYITVNRPTALPGNARPRSFASSATKEFVPPSSPVSQNTKRVRMSDGDMSRTDMSRNMTNTPPLPPIGSASSREIHGEPPRSPPGSSMRQSPPHVQEVISPLK